jgi:hypothetical protein
MEGPGAGARKMGGSGFSRSCLAARASPLVPRRSCLAARASPLALSPLVPPPLGAPSASCQPLTELSTASPAA